MILKGVALPALHPSLAVADTCRQLGDVIACYAGARGGDGHFDTPVPGMAFTQNSTSHHMVGNIADPALGIIVQGNKRVMLGDEIYTYGAGQHMVVSVDLPLCGAVIDATAAKPYLGFKLSLDRALLCDLLPLSRLAVAPARSSGRGIFTSGTDPRLLESVHRLVRLLDTPEDIPALAPLVIREIHYLLLNGDQGEAVRQMAVNGSPMNRIADVLRTLREDFARPLSVPALAEQARMSPSTFHQHFKQVTSLSPLQYQKQLRLVEARRLMLSGHLKAESASYTVGYESPSQFSREYARLFGAPPITDMARLRGAEDVSLEQV
ncbi:HTH-type transcriptional activator RhaS [Asticcacaulis sp. MM231]|uniref:AraC family transcriptional regulator n=1 Tax=Asticcacaulis sp. MM231 TaxID=3157666 RepID=UPI0032D583C3